MADEKVTELDPKTTFTDTDLFVLMDEAAAPDETKYITGNHLKAQVAAELAYLGSDELDIRTLVGQRAISVIHKAWWNLDGITQNHTGGSFITAFWNGDLDSGGLNNQLACVYSGTIWHNHASRGCMTGLQISPRHSVNQIGFIGWMGDTTFDRTSAHYGFWIVDDEIFATSGNGVDEEASAALDSWAGAASFDLSIAYGLSNIKFYIDHVLVATLSTYRPTSTALKFMAYIQTNEVANKAIYIRPVTILAEHAH